MPTTAQAGVPESQVQELVSLGRPSNITVSSHVNRQIPSSLADRITTTMMPSEYAEDQPQGFSNYIERIALVGVC